MATEESFVLFLADQLALAGTITYRKMFGEYGLYCDGKFFGTAEDNQLFLKITDAGRTLAPNAVIASPHEGAHYLLIDAIEDRVFLADLVRATCAALPDSKPKKIKKKHTL